MPHFLFAYNGGMQPDPPEETEVEIERWGGWFDRIGPAIVDPGEPCRDCQNPICQRRE